MQLPTIHLGGTSKQALLDAVCEAQSALENAIEKLHKASPNPRDYPDITPVVPTFAIAQREHRMRLASLVSVAVELQDLAQQISDIGE